MKYVKKPVEIEALFWDGTFTGMENIKKDFAELTTLSVAYNETDNKVFGWKIGTLEGGHKVSPTDYIIKGIKGEFYPCKNDIFHMTYDEA